MPLGGIKLGMGAQMIGDQSQSNIWILGIFLVLGLLSKLQIKKSNVSLETFNFNLVMKALWWRTITGKQVEDSSDLGKTR